MQEPPPNLNSFLQPEYGTTDLNPTAQTHQRRDSAMPEAFELLADTLGADPLPLAWRQWNAATQYGGQFDFGRLLRAHVYRLALPNIDVRSHGNIASHLSAHRPQADRLGLTETPSRSTFSRVWNALTDEQHEQLRNYAAASRRKAAATGVPASSRIAPEPDDDDEITEIPSAEKTRAVEHLRSFCYEQLGFDRAHNTSYHRDGLLDVQAEVSRETGFVQGTIEDRWTEGDECHTPKTHFNAVQNVELDEWRDRFHHVFEMQVQAAKNAGMLQRKVPIHIDATIIPYYKRGPTDELPEGVTGNVKARGTHYGYKHVTVSAQDKGRSICLATFDVSDRGQMEDAVKDIVEKADEMIHIESLSMDSEFGKAELIRWLEERDIPLYVHLPRRGNRLKRMLVQMSGKFDQGAYSFGEGAYYEPTIEGTVIVERDYDENEPDGPEPGGGHEAGSLSMFGAGVDHSDIDLDDIDDQWWRRWRPYFTTADVSEGEVETHIRQYKRRWSIETKYRVIKDEFLGRTTTRDYTSRTFFWLFAVMMYNAWVLLDIFMRADYPDLVPEDRPAMPARMFAKQFFKVIPD